MANRIVDPVEETDAAFNPGSVVSIGTSSATLVAANPARVELFITNTHATQVLSLRLGAGPAVAGEGIVLAAGGSVVLDSYTGIVTAVASGAGTTVALAEV